MFPTVIRNTALGVGSMCARLSAALTPLITLLVYISLLIYSLWQSTPILWKQKIILCIQEYELHYLDK